MGKELRITIKNDKFLHYVKFIERYVGDDLETILRVPFRTTLRNQMYVSKQFDFKKVQRVLRDGYHITPLWRDGHWYALIRPFKSPSTTSSNYVVLIERKLIFKKITPGKYNKLYRDERKEGYQAYRFVKEHLGMTN